MRVARSSYDNVEAAIAYDPKQGGVFEVLVKIMAYGLTKMRLQKWRLESVADKGYSGR